MGVFSGKTKVSGTSIVKLIDEFMDVKGSVGKAKTISDKVAAFRYLRELVGDTFLVENLNRDHFLEVRKILSAYPTNARKLKVLKNKTLQEKSAYAVKHKLALMSKQNANKIIRRLKSLMVYAVATGVIMKNPCTLIDFHISEAERAASAREKLSNEQLVKLFMSEAFDLDYPLGPAMYWVPLIALFHGFRMEEILLLTLKEIRRDSITGIRYFNLTEFTTDDLKNANALRRVPFHPILKKLGFEKYLASCKNNKGLRLFPELKRATGMDSTYRKLFSPIV